MSGQAAVRVDPCELRKGFDGRGRNRNRVLLAEDTFVSGASIRSACAELSAAGATVIGPLVFGRMAGANITIWWS